jgi:hypothetical protein
MFACFYPNLVFQEQWTYHSMGLCFRMNHLLGLTHLI